MNESCSLCAAKDGIYNWECDECCARFLSHAPTKVLRAAWLNRWMQQFGEARTEHIKELVKVAWEKQKQEALRFGKGENHE